ncbi:unnamed protein product [Lactuca saligna]|uniref:K Homology domain-containing protein n=1 Tax=Lactuca saligna TaxID=75948 RepID=A0AA35V5W1_LACSI|nr:unnamed protein product [Lactuca saligna]
MWLSRSWYWLVVLLCSQTSMLVAMKLMPEEDYDTDVWVRVMSMAQGIKVDMMGRDISTGSTSVGRSAAIVSNMSVEILVPQTIIALVYGENGSNLTHLRQHISGANVVEHEPRSGTSDHIVLISGTPNETRSAQSLLQASILADQS